MRDRLAARHLAPGALDIDMDPLMVAGRIGEFVDLLLGHRIPVADPDLLALIGFQIGRAFDFQHQVLLIPRLIYTSSRRRPGSTGQPPVRQPGWIPASAGMTT